MELTLNVLPREKNEKLSHDFIAAVLYGKGVENKEIKVERVKFEKMFATAGESNLINLVLGDSKVKVLVKDWQKDAIKNFFTHIDFYQVNMKEKINTAIPLHFIGESKAVKELGGMLMKEVNEIEVECMPDDLVDHIDVDISAIVELEESLRISDVKIPEGMTLLNRNAEDIVAMVMRPKVAEVFETAPGTVEATDVKDAKEKEAKEEEEVKK